MKQVVENRDWLIRRAKQGAPFEVCGFILDDGSIIEIPNSAIDPITQYFMLRCHLIDRVPNPERIVAIWHSHPNGNCQPSHTDMMAVRNGHINYKWVYLIVTKDGVFQHNMTLENENDISIAVRTLAI